jgi:hypothetical protein
MKLHELGQHLVGAAVPTREMALLLRRAREIGLCLCPQARPPLEGCKAG